MLPPFIIEQIRRREEQERVRHEQPRVEIPADRPAPRAPIELMDGASSALPGVVWNA